MKENQQIVIYKTEDGQLSFDVNLNEETVWLTQKQMAGLFDRDRVAITQHIGNIFKEEELAEKSVCKEFLHTAEDGKSYKTKHYNLDVIMSVGHRVKSHKTAHFVKWAESILYSNSEVKLANIASYEQKIFEVRGLKVMIDIDLAELYQVSTKALNQAVKRNEKRFPKEFMIRLTDQEKTEVVTICDHLDNLKYSRVNPMAFTEHGVLMLANILKSNRAIGVSIQLVKTFVKLREQLVSGMTMTEVVKKLETHELKIQELSAGVRAFYSDADQKTQVISKQDVLMSAKRLKVTKGEEKG